MLIYMCRYNLYLSSTIGRKGKFPRGEKKIKTRIKDLFVVNIDGSHKYKLSVINTYKQPLCFCAAGINLAKLPVYDYYYTTP